MFVQGFFQIIFCDNFAYLRMKVSIKMTMTIDHTLGRSELIANFDGQRVGAWLTFRHENFNLRWSYEYEAVL